jgi:hypothetical protein
MTTKSQALHCWFDFHCAWFQSHNDEP